MSNPFLSVIVPTYNIADYIQRCIDSITNQTFKDLEIIIVDDGSTDATGTLCDELAVNDSRIRVFHKENGGSSSARNLGIDNARGSYLAFVDSDDYIEPDMYELLVAGITADGTGDAHKIVQIGRNEIDEQGNLLPDICIPPVTPEFVSAHDFYNELLMHRGDCSFCTKIIARELFGDRRFPIGELNEDFKLLVGMLKTTDGVMSLPGHKYHVFYRIGSNSRKKNKDEFSRVFTDNVVNADMVYSVVPQLYPDLEPVAFRFGIYQRIDYMLHIPIALMNSDNKFYVGVKKMLRKSILTTLKNPILSRKNKIYALIFAFVPRTARKIHGKVKKIS